MYRDKKHNMNSETTTCVCIPQVQERHIIVESVQITIMWFPGNYQSVSKVNIIIGIILCGKIRAITILIRVRGKVRGWVQFCTCLMGNTLH